MIGTRNTIIKIIYHKITTKEASETLNIFNTILKRKIKNKIELQELSNNMRCKEYHVTFALLPARGGHYYTIKERCSNSLLYGPIPSHIISYIINKKLKNNKNKLFHIIFWKAKRFTDNQLIDINFIIKNIKNKEILLYPINSLNDIDSLDRNIPVIPLTVLPGKLYIKLKNNNYNIIFKSLLDACPVCIVNWIVDCIKSSKL